MEPSHTRWSGCRVWQQIDSYFTSLFCQIWAPDIPWDFNFVSCDTYGNELSIMSKKFFDSDFDSWLKFSKDFTDWKNKQTNKKQNEHSDFCNSPSFSPPHNLCFTVIKMRKMFSVQWRCTIQKPTAKCWHEYIHHYKRIACYWKTGNPQRMPYNAVQHVVRAIAQLFKHFSRHWWSWTLCSPRKTDSCSGAFSSTLSHWVLFRPKWASWLIL